MNWTSIRLELACTQDFPHGSPSRCYLLRLPLTGTGLIDEDAVRAAPGRATVRRFWPSQADMRGTIFKTPKGWVFSFEPGESENKAVFDLKTHAIRIGEYVTLNELDGESLPFRIASMEAIT